MAEEVKPPVAIRITRPYLTEEEFLEREFDSLSRTSVVLVGAQPRPQGVILRFEIVLKSGASVLRGEGRVVGYKDVAYGNEAGLTLRFTRLDSKSKALVDRAGALREARSRASMPPESRRSSPAGLSAPPPALEPSSPPSSNNDATLPEPRIMTISRPTEHAPPPVPTAPPSPPPPAFPPPEARRSTPPPIPVFAQPPPPPPNSGFHADLESTQVESLPSSALEAAPPSVAPVPHRSTPPPLRRITSPGVAPPPVTLTNPPLAIERPEPLPAASPRTAAPIRNGHSPTASRLDPIEAPAERSELLSRLRDRARALPAERISEILAPRTK